MNIISYVKRNQNSFDIVPFNEADSLVLSQYSYLSFPCDMAEHVALDVLSCRRKELSSDTLSPLSNVRLLKAIVKSRRYSNVVAECYREYNSVETETRFAAITFRISPHLHYIAFRGTDVTLLGWKEDFNLAISNVIPSQTLALQYLEEVASKTEGDLIIGGHSKGGNMAVYAAIYASERVKNRIVAVYNHDGPGFCEDIFSLPQFTGMASRIYKTVPHNSIIGMLLNASRSYSVVKSRSISVLQHNPFSWQIGKDWNFVKLDFTASCSVAIKIALTLWIDGMNEHVKKEVVEAIYVVACGSGAETVPQFIRHPFKCIRAMKRTYAQLDEERKRLLADSLKRLRMLRKISRKAVREQCEKRR